MVVGSFLGRLEGKHDNSEVGLRTKSSGFPLMFNVVVRRREPISQPFTAAPFFTV